MVTAERYGLNGSTTGQAALAIDIAVAAQAGFRYLELRDTKIEAWLNERSLEALRAEFEQAGVAPLSVNALEDATLSRDPRATAGRGPGGGAGGAGFRPALHRPPGRCGGPAPRRTHRRPPPAARPRGDTAA